MSARSASVTGCRSASAAGVRCSGRPGPITTWVTRSSASSQPSASPASEVPRDAAIASSRSSASKVAPVTRSWYGSGRWVIRDPAGYAAPRRYFPVSQPPASGPNAR